MRDGATTVHYQLYGTAAWRYDLHTPPHRFERSHHFVADWLRARLGPGGAVLDVGCGTGVFLARVRAAGLAAQGIDAATEMVAVARKRLGAGVVKVGRMEELADHQRWDAVIALGWVLHYCSSLAGVGEVLGRFFHALRPGGRLVLQLAHAAHASGQWREERQPGPSGEPDDVTLAVCYASLPGPEPRLRAAFRYTCRSLDEELAEEHVLHAADARQIAERVRAAGFAEVELLDSWRQDPFATAVSPLLTARRPAG